MKAMAYLRVSSPQQAQDDRNGYDRQLTTIKQYAQQNNIKIETVYKESFTGTEMKRPELEKMILDMLTTDDIRLILVESMDRFSRNAVAGFNHVLELQIQEIDLIDTSTGESMKELLNGHPLQRFMVQVRLLVSELERNLTSHRLQQGRERASKKAGHYVAGVQQRYSPRQVRKIHTLRKQGKTLQQIADRLNSQGTTTPTGKPHTPQTVAWVVNKANNNNEEE